MRDPSGGSTDPTEPVGRNSGRGLLLALLVVAVAVAAYLLSR